MTQKRTWSQRQRSVEACVIVLRDLDERTLARRAKRLSIEPVNEFPVDYHIPNRTGWLLDEAGACFTNGQYTGCVLALAAAAEHGLREKLGMPQKAVLDELIKKAVNSRIVSNDNAEVLNSLKDYRNDAIHSNIDNLASGTRLKRSNPRFTEQGVVQGSEWTEFEPESQDEKEIAAELVAERIVERLLIQVQEILFDVFDR